jgi:hypothetical protein
MSTEKTYVPRCSAKVKKFESGNSILKLSFHAQTMADWLLAHANEKGYVNLGVSRRKEVGKYGDTHCVWLDTWKPEPKPADAAAPSDAMENDAPPF